MISLVTKDSEALLQASASHDTEAEVVVRSVISSVTDVNCVTLSSSIPLMVNSAVSVEVPFDVNSISAEKMISSHQVYVTKHQSHAALYPFKANVSGK